MRVSSASAWSSSVRVKKSSSLRVEDGEALAWSSVTASTSFAGNGTGVRCKLERPTPRAGDVRPSRRLADDEGEGPAALLTEPLPFVGSFASHWGFAASERKFVPTRRMPGGR